MMMMMTTKVISLSLSSTLFIIRLSSSDGYYVSEAYKEENGGVIECSELLNFSPPKFNQNLFLPNLHYSQLVAEFDPIQNHHKKTVYLLTE